MLSFELGLHFMLLITQVWHDKETTIIPANAGISARILDKYARSPKKIPKQSKGDCYLHCIAEQLPFIKLVALWGRANQYKR
jgi:hypothetical protein